MRGVEEGRGYVRRGEDVEGGGVLKEREVLGGQVGCNARALEACIDVRGGYSGNGGVLLVERGAAPV